MKIEFLHHYQRAPRPHAARPAGRLPAALRARTRRALGAAPQPARPRARPRRRSAERWLGFSRRALAAALAQRPGPRRRGRSARGRPRRRPRGRPVRRHLQPLLRAREPRAPPQRVLAAAGYRVHRCRAADGARPLCCGRTFLAAGLVDEARAEARRTLAALAAVRRARRAASSGSSPPASSPCATSSWPCSRRRGRARSPRAPCCSRSSSPRESPPAASASRSSPLPRRRRSLHGHCHQKAFGAHGRRRSGSGARPRPRRRADRVELLRHGRRLRLRGRAPRGLAAPWPSCACCRRCASGAGRRSSSPTARAAATRSTTAPAARRSMWRACSMRRLLRAAGASSPIITVDNRQTG